MLTGLICIGIGTCPQASGGDLAAALEFALGPRPDGRPTPVRLSRAERARWRALVHSLRLGRHDDASLSDAP